MQSYRDIDAWHRAHRFSINIWRMAGTFPRGNAGLVEQLTDAADSIPRNIVEGAGAATRREFARFLDISIKSTTECQYHLESARDRGLIEQSVWQHYDQEVVEIRRMIYGFRRALIAADEREKRAMKARKARKIRSKPSRSD
jgi:four helix bundle protein